jgi:transcription elongation factor GreA-like protein/transcription elongation GreA/GreB family factor
MTYLQEFRDRINSNDLKRVLQLWEEYIHGDVVDTEEFKQILQMLKISDLLASFGPYVETVLPFWGLIKDPQASYEVLRLIIDLQTTNSPTFANLALDALEKRFSQEPQFRERLRVIGLRGKQNFQGAISNYELLAHLSPGKFVFHTKGWGAGEVVDVSALREQASIEFENITGRRDISFSNAFKLLVPISDDHFLARRFGNPDLLEKEAREKPLEVIKMLLRDLGPKTASEIKDEMADWVIPESEWSKWWQGVRAKIKKDTMIESPDSLKEPFRLLQTAVQHEERLHEEIHGKTEAAEILHTTYSYVRDFPNMLKKAEVKTSIKEKLLGLLSSSNVTPEIELQIIIFLEHLLNESVSGKSIEKFIQQRSDAEKIVDSIDILALKKRGLIAIRQYRKDWADMFISLLFKQQQSQIRDYLFQELNQGETVSLILKKLEDLIRHPEKNPELFIWYFQKAVSGDEVPFNDKKGSCQLLEGLLILLNKLESKQDTKDLIKKVYQIISAKRYAIIRSILEGCDIEFAKEFLLLVSKCQTLGDHEIKIMHSLAEVVHPSLGTKKSKVQDQVIVWTTEEAYFRTKEKLAHLGTVVMVENAKEIEAARALGDLRENSEYKAALERRSRLQSEIRGLSDLLNKARIITKDDIVADEVGIGSVVKLESPVGGSVTYTILGPWDADPDQNVLSFQSKLAEAMMGHRTGESFEFRNETFKIKNVKSYLAN